MNKTTLIEKVAQNMDGTKKKAEVAVNAIFDTLEESLSSGNEVRLVGFGSFSVSKRNSRTGRNPQTGELMTIPANYTVKFKPGKELKDKIQK
mgnify:CR=1 FL=1